MVLAEHTLYQCVWYALHILRASSLVPLTFRSICACITRTNFVYTADKGSDRYCSNRPIKLLLHADSKKSIKTNVTGYASASYVFIDPISGSCQDSTYTCRPPIAIHIMNRCPGRRIETDSLIGKMFVFEKLKIASVIGLSQSSERHLGGRWS